MPRKKKKAGLFGRFRKPTKKQSAGIKRRVMLMLLVSLLAGLAGGALAVYVSVSGELPKIAALKDYSPPPGTLVLSADDHLIGRIKADKGIYVALANIPDPLKHAVVAVEDARFYSHRGFDWRGITRAMFRNIFSGRFKEGGSTITQQLAKVMFLTPEKSLVRKLKEAVLARRLESELTKDEILELYLNRIYFGHGAYGVEMAARSYFGKRVGDLTLPECALIAGLIRSPANYSPYNSMERARGRRGVVLQRMADERFISRGRAEEADKSPVVLANLRLKEDVAPHFVEEVRLYLLDRYGAEAVYETGLTVKTTIYYGMQKEANEAVDKGLRELDKRVGWRGPVGNKGLEDVSGKEARAGDVVVLKPGQMLYATVMDVDIGGATLLARGAPGRLSARDMDWALRDEKGGFRRVDSVLSPGDIIEVRVVEFDGERGTSRFALEQTPEVQAALVAMEPETGFVRAMVGGSDFRLGEFNHAMNARRQPGSAFKPFVYALAMDSGFSPASVFMDEPKEYDEGGWQPTNYDGEYKGPTSLREALVHSGNVVTVELLSQVGVDNVVDLAEALGMEGPFANDLTLALGSCSVTPLELAAGYCALDNGGNSVRPVMILEVLDPAGRDLETARLDTDGVMSEEAAYLVTDMLVDAAKRGTARGVEGLGRTVAAKTGTTDDYVDAWLAGYTPDLVAVSWVGYDDNRSLGWGETGARAALPIWKSFMSMAALQYEEREFAVPEGISYVEVDADTGGAPTALTKNYAKEPFKKEESPVDEDSWLYRVSPGNLKRIFTNWSGR